MTFLYLSLSAFDSGTPREHILRKLIWLYWYFSSRSWQDQRGSKVLLYGYSRSIYKVGTFEIFLWLYARLLLIRGPTHHVMRGSIHCGLRDHEQHVEFRHSLYDPPPKGSKQCLRRNWDCGWNWAEADSSWPIKVRQRNFSMKQS
jgi:hypothetical protein